MKIRQCNVNDLEVLQDLSRETYTATFGQDNTEENLNAYLEKAYNTKQLTSELTNQDSRFYFIYQDEQLAGYLKLNILTAQSEEMPDNYMEVERVYFKTAYQHLGLGTKVFEFAEEQAKKLSKDSIWLGVWEFNYPAQKFYQKMGFERFSEHKFVMGDSVQTDFLMKKNLRVEK